MFYRSAGFLTSAVFRKLGDLEFVAVALAAVIHGFLVALVAFRAGERSLVLRVRVDVVAPLGLLDHGVVVSVAGDADLIVALLLDLMVRRVAGLALDALGDMPVGKEWLSGGAFGRQGDAAECAQDGGEQKLLHGFSLKNWPAADPARSRPIGCFSRGCRRQPQISVLGSFATRAPVWRP
jgi:hypothetical protein